MTLDEYLQKNNGGWNGNTAFVVIEDYRWKVAYKEAGEVKLTADGVRMGAPDSLAYASAGVVISEAKTKGRKPKVAEVAEDFDELDDMDI